MIRSNNSTPTNWGKIKFEKPSKRFILAPVDWRIFCTSDFLSGVNVISLNLITLEKLNLNKSTPE